MLHVVRYGRKDLDKVIDQINATGYGLTFGVHTRIDETIAKVIERAPCRQPLRQPQHGRRGGRGAALRPAKGLSGTGPKAGGPLYLYRLLSTRPDGDPAVALAKGSTGETEWQVRDALRQQAGNPLGALHDWARQQGLGELEQACLRFAEESLSGLTRLLPGRPASATATACCHVAGCCAWRPTTAICCCNWQRSWRWAARR